jgi:alkylation response protein AidB-like acyl-CoA dehydrogenase
MAVLTEEQTMLKDAARGWVAEYAPVSAFRKLRDAGETGVPAQYADMAQMGWTGIMIEEEHGGVGMGLTEMTLVLEEMGRQLVASPLFISALASAAVLRAAGSAAQQAAWLPRIADGSCVMTLAIDEGAHHDIRQTATTARRTGDGYRLSGTKTHIVEGMGADQMLILARTSGRPGDAEGLTLFLAPADQLDRKPLITLDKRDYARITLEGLTLPESAVVGEVGGAVRPLESALDMARIGLAAEMLGLCNQAFDTTLDYLKTRKQFDTVLAQFQALQHRMADLFCNMELVRSTVEHAARAVDAGAEDATEAAILAKSMANDFANLMSRQMVQIHGGIGMTDLHDAGLYLKRARALEALFGNTAWQNERFAQLHGY